MGGPTDDERHEYISYERFGMQFFEWAVTHERVLGAVAMLSGQPINVGPLGVGPGRIAKVTARGAIGSATAEALTGDPISYRVVLPVALDFELDLQLETQRFQADLEVPIMLAARAAWPLKLVIDVVPPQPHEVGLQLQSQGIRASLLNRVVGIDGELKRFVAGYVARELDKPYVQSARVIDVGGAIDGAWASLTPIGRSHAAQTVAHDFEEAIEVEILGNDSVADEVTDDSRA